MPAADLLRLIRAVLDDQKITRGGSDLPTPPQPAAGGRLWRTRPRARTKSVLMREPSNTFSLCTIVFPSQKSFHTKRELRDIFFLSAAKPLIGWFVRRQAGIGRHSAAEVPAILPSSCRTSSDQHHQLWLS